MNDDTTSENSPFLHTESVTSENGISMTITADCSGPPIDSKDGVLEALTAATARAEAAEASMRELRLKIESLETELNETRGSLEGSRCNVREAQRQRDLMQGARDDSDAHIQKLITERDELTAQVAVCVQALELIDSHGVLDYRFINKIISNLPAAAREMVEERDRLREKCAPVEEFLTPYQFDIRDGGIKQIESGDMPALIAALNGFSGVQP